MALLGPTTSRRNKIALLAEYRRQGELVDWHWKGTPYESRLLVSFGDQWRECMSYDEDIRPKMQDVRPVRSGPDKG